jgi:energy-coupling factor transporter ATP-binding protein EcfA2
VAALLELGAGFNPEFTGRENVYLNAAIMGLSQREIESRFDAVAAFADIGDFIEQPVKTYSSGMYVRLAFAVATSVEPDILIVDEALSVGDIAFQNKCMMRIKKLKNRGTTVLFVSHDLSTLQMICDRVIWLHDGVVKAIGDPIKTSQEYYVHMTGTKFERQHSHKDLIMQQSTGMARFIELNLDSVAAGQQAIFNVGEDIVFRFAVEADKPLDKIVFAVSIYRADGDWLIGQTSHEAGSFWPAAAKGELRRGRFALRANCLAPGDYLAAFAAYSEDISICYAMTELTLSFSVRANFPTWGKFVHPAVWESVL